MRSYRSVALWAVCFVSLTLCAAGAFAQETKKKSSGKRPSPVAPVPQDRPGWQERQASFNARVKQGDAELIFLGDSITQLWEQEGREVWEQYYGQRKAVNLGIDGDATQNVLWRLDHGNLEGIRPKLAVVMIGTNNTSSNPPEEVAEGVKAVVERLRTKQPQMKVLLLGIFPRGADNESLDRQRVVKANALIAKLGDDQHVFYLDLGPKFLAADGTLSKEIMPDLLHPNKKGYAIWAAAIEPTVAKLLR